MPRPLLLGHRGLRNPAGPPENTFDAFDACLNAGCDGFEFDVRLSADGGLVVVHDPWHLGLEVARTPVAELNLPSLEQVIARYAHRAFLDIEVKVPGIAQQVVRAVTTSLFPRGFFVSSFLPELLFDLRAQDEAVPLGFICDRRDTLALWRELPIHYLVPHYKLLSRKLVDEAHARSIKLFTWTVNQPREMVRFGGRGVDAIVSDDPALLVKILAHSGAPHGK